jgi:hypothetical protein
MAKKQSKGEFDKKIHLHLFLIHAILPLKNKIPICNFVIYIFSQKTFKDEK